MIELIVILQTAYLEVSIMRYKQRVPVVHKHAWHFMSSCVVIQG